MEIKKFKGYNVKISGEQLYHIVCKLYVWRWTI